MKNARVQEYHKRYQVPSSSSYYVLSKNVNILYADLEVNYFN